MGIASKLSKPSLTFKVLVTTRLLFFYALFTPKNLTVNCLIIKIYEIPFKSILKIVSYHTNARSCKFGKVCNFCV